jgi:hypothetical protein
MNPVPYYLLVTFNLSPSIQHSAQSNFHFVASFRKLLDHQQQTCATTFVIQTYKSVSYIQSAARLEVMHWAGVVRLKALQHERFYLVATTDANAPRPTAVKSSPFHMVSSISPWSGK